MADDFAAAVSAYREAVERLDSAPHDRANRRKRVSSEGVRRTEEDDHG